MSGQKPLCWALVGFTLVRFLVFYILANRFPNHRTPRTYKPKYSESTSKGIKIKWSKESYAMEHYVYRKTGNDTYKKIADITM